MFIQTLFIIFYKKYKFVLNKNHNSLVSYEFEEISVFFESLQHRIR